MQDTIFTINLQEYSNEELVELFQTTQEEKYLEALSKKNTGIITHIANTYSLNHYTDLEDLVEIGYIELWRASKSYEAGKGANFCTYLTKFIKQKYNRIFNEAHRAKRFTGELPSSYEDMEEIHKEHYRNDDNSNLYIEEFLDTITGTTKQVVELLLDGFSKSEVARRLEIAPASVTWHVKRLQRAYTEWEVA